MRRGGEIEGRAPAGAGLRAIAAFDTGFAVLAMSDPALAEYMRQTRAYSECLVERRNAVEHERWILPHVTYARTDVGVEASEPSVAGQPVSEFVTFIFDPHLLR